MFGGWLSWKVWISLIETFPAHLSSKYLHICPRGSLASLHSVGLRSVVPLVFTGTEALPGGRWGKRVEYDGGILKLVPFFYSLTNFINFIIKDHLLYKLSSHTHFLGPFLMIFYAFLPFLFPSSFSPFWIFLIRVTQS